MAYRVGLLPMVGLLVQLLGATTGVAQEGAFTRPRFIATWAPTGEPADASNAAVLQRRVSLDLADAPLGTALREIATQARLDLSYEQSVLPTDRLVALHAREITVVAALTEVLLNAGLDVAVGKTGQLALIRRASAAAVEVGAVVGRVTDAKTGSALVGAEVFLDRTGRRTATGESGFYRLADVEAGSYTLTVRRVGYAKRSQAVTVVAAQDITLDVVLDPVATHLDEIVSTVTGDQRRVELGHVVGVINADSLVKEAPVSNLSELLTARVPGLQVFQSQGTVGGDVSVRIRGSNSLLLSDEPIVVIDGVRYTSRAANVAPSFIQAERTSPLNDINPNDIESIEVVKGPSAATLYGTDASSGVIVITTKRGAAGPARWNAYARGTTSTIPRGRFPDIYWGWDKTQPNGSCALARMASGGCKQDSVTVLPNPRNDPELSIVGSAPAWQYGTNVSGGRQDLSYYFSGEYSTATGAVRMPPPIASQLLKARGLSQLPEGMQNPNSLRNVNLKGNITVRLGERAEVQFHSGYISGNTRSMPLGIQSPYLSSFTPNDPYGRSQQKPAEAFAQSLTESTDRYFGSLSGEWRATSWLRSRVTVGQDLTSRHLAKLVRRGDEPSAKPWTGGAPTGYVSDDRVRQLSTTAELGLTATARAGRLSSRTSIGAQYVRSVNDALSAAGRDLRPGGTSIGDAAEIFPPHQTYDEAVTLGTYVEQMVGLNDRLYLTGALRVDGASSFGQGYNAAAYPKVGASWLPSAEPFFPHVPGLDELRLRYAYGASGQQPLPGWSLPSFEVNPANVRGTPMTVIGVQGIGNPLLRPERVREHEFGLDAAGFQNRVQLGLTWYNRRTVDQIVSMSLPPGLGSIYTNVGLTTQHGFELELRAALVESPWLSWNIAAQHSMHRTMLVHLGDATPLNNALGGYQEGYPLGARFRYPISHYADANGDGLINPFDPAELTIDFDHPVYMGESTPPRSQTLGTTVGLLRHHLRLSALLERRTGFTQVNSFKSTMCFSVCRQAVDPTTPLPDMAESAALYTLYSFIEPGDFTRLREVTLSLDLPVGLVRALGMRSATVTASGRNLALWTKFSGPDPESAFVSGLSGGEANGLPQARSWTLRFDVGL